MKTKFSRVSNKVNFTVLTKLHGTIFLQQLKLYKTKTKNVLDAPLCSYNVFEMLCLKKCNFILKNSYYATNFRSKTRTAKGLFFWRRRRKEDCQERVGRPPSSSKNVRKIGSHHFWHSVRTFVSFFVHFMLRVCRKSSVTKRAGKRFFPGVRSWNRMGFEQDLNCCQFRISNLK